jgi:hypothetical protein
MRPASNRTWLVLLLIATAALLSTELWLPLSNDNEIYQSMANELFRFHRLPYVGTWDQNFPAIVGIHWLSIALFGNSAFGFHLFDVCLHVLLSAILFALFQRWFSRPISFTGVLFYQARYLFTQSVIGQRDCLAVFFLAIGCWLLFSTKSRRWSAWAPFLVGVSFAIVLLFRITYAPLAVVPILYLWYSSDRLRQIFTYAIGYCLPLLALLLIYLQHPGALRETYLSTITFNLKLYGAAPAPLSLFILRTKPPIVIPMLVGLMLVIFRGSSSRPNVRNVWQEVRRPSKPEQLVVISVAIVSLVSIIIMRKFFSYHYEPLMAIESPFAGLAIIAAYTATRNQVLRIAIIILLAGYASYEVLKLEFTPNGVSRESETAAAYINGQTNGVDRVEVADFSAALRWRIHAEPASRFTTSHALFATTQAATHPPFQRQWQLEYIDSLRFNRPRFLALSSETADIFPWARQGPSTLVHELPGFDSLVFVHYEYDTTIANYQIFRWKG